MDELLKKLKAERERILKEALAIQTEHVGKAMEAKVGEAYEKLCGEAAVLQKQYDEASTLLALEDSGVKIDAGHEAAAAAAAREPVLPLVPADNKGARGRKGADDEVIGYAPIGTLAFRSEAFKEMQRTGAFVPHIQLFKWSSTVDDQPLGIKGMIPLTRKEYQAGLEAKTVPSIGAGVIEADRLSDVVRIPGFEELTIRDLLPVLPTGSDTVSWVKRVYTAAAATVAAGAAKPESAIVLTLVTTPVQVIAAQMPVQNQQLQDVAGLAAMVNEELLFDVRQEEENQIVWGDGTGTDLTGLMSSSLPTARALTTLLDIAKGMFTDIRVTREGLPTGLAIHPLDAESMFLLKGSDNHYLNQVFPNADGTLRVWGIQMVESTGCEANLGSATEQRVMIAADWRRGASLHDRMANAVTTGWIDDQFIKNMVTVLAEERVALAVKRTGAFVTHETQADVP